MNTTCAKGHVLADVGVYVYQTTGQVSCKACVKERSAERYSANRAEVNSQKRTESFRAAQRTRRPARYGLATWEHKALVDRQGDLCAICHEPETALSNQGDLRPLSIDHDHETGTVRGLLCNRCNRALGYLRDDLGLAESVVWYLRFALRDQLAVQGCEERPRA